MTLRLFPIAVAAVPLAAAALASTAGPRPETAPAGTPDTRYCMRVEAVTGSHVEPVVCWTRAEWREQGVDVDRDWPREGVRVIGKS